MSTRLHFQDSKGQRPGLLTSVLSRSASDEVSSLSFMKQITCRSLCLLTRAHTHTHTVGWVVSRQTFTALCPNVLTDLEHVLRGPIHHPDDGAVLHLHWSHIQRLFLKVPQHLRLRMERESHVYSGGVEVSVSVKVYWLYLFFSFAFLEIFFFFRSNMIRTLMLVKASVFISFSFLLCVLPTGRLISEGAVLSLLIQTWREFSTDRILSESTRWVAISFSTVLGELQDRFLIIIRLIGEKMVGKIIWVGYISTGVPVPSQLCILTVAQGSVSWPILNKQPCEEISKLDSSDRNGSFALNLLYETHSSL